MIAIPNFSPKDGLYYIDKGRIHKYKGKGGTVRVYDLIDDVIKLIIDLMGEKVARPTATSSTEVAWWIGE